MGAGSCLSSSSEVSAEDRISEVCEEGSSERLQDAVRILIQGLGEDVKREGLRDTPKRVAKAWLDASAGYHQSVKSVLGGALFHEPLVDTGCGGVVIVRDIEFASTSETNLLPFYGRCHIGYVPSQGVVLGLSKVARLARMYARRLQTQERFTQELLQAFEAHVHPQGCAVLVEARHLSQGPTLPVHASSAASGCLRQDWRMQEFLTLLRLHAPAAPLPSADCTRSGIALQAVAGNGCESAVEHMARDAAAVCPSGLDGLGLPAQEHMERAVEAILCEIGEDPLRPGLLGSATRYVRALLASTTGYKHRAVAAEPRALPGIRDRVAFACMPSTHGVVRLASLQFASQCEHHMLPFFGEARVLFVTEPSAAPLAPGVLEALLGSFSRRLQIQERLTQELVSAVHTVNGAVATLVVCEAVHMCMVARGVEKHASSTVTCAARGACKADGELRTELLKILNSASFH
ncbi:hypothetical protein WJX81_005403 [Elliptochloris bilobata]|uniref:GTP cyclohydrolase 1 n=1 Tax=Elliptochloris bilobata TaxID=381761 RepID=A0AAW1S914_9CHLO